MWLTLKNLILLTCFLFRFGATNDSLLDSTVSSIGAKTPQACWKSGGYVSNRVHKFSDVQINNSLQGAFKVVKGEQRVAYNFGTLFETPSTKRADSAENQEFTTNYDAGKPQYLRFEKDQKTKWAEYKASDNLDVLCETVTHYKCLQTFIISSDREVNHFSESNCPELHGDLIITYADDKKLLESLKKLKKIHGRLIISGAQSMSGLDFTILEEIGDFIFHGTSPSLQITSNRLSYVKFPALKTVHCQKEKNRQCVVIGENWMLIEKPTMTKILLGNSYLTQIVSTDQLQKRSPGGGSYSSVADLQARKISYSIEQWYDDFISGYSVLYVVFAALCFLGCVAVIVWAKLSTKKSYEYDYVAIDKLAVAAEQEELKESSDGRDKTEKSKSSHPPQ